jgi:hypothetical protein
MKTLVPAIIFALAFAFAFAVDIGYAQNVGNDRAIAAPRGSPQYLSADSLLPILESMDPQVADSAYAAIRRRSTGSGALECGQNLTLNANGDSAIVHWSRVLEPTGMTYVACSSGLGWCEMQLPTGGAGTYEFEYYGGFTLSNLPSGSTAQLVVYIDGAPTDMVKNFTANGLHDLTFQSFPSQYWPVGTTASLYFGVIPAGTGAGVTMTVRSGIRYCYFDLEWLYVSSRRDVADTLEVSRRNAETSSAGALRPLSPLRWPDRLAFGHSVVTATA